jgi:hypothetical protein
MVLLVTGIRIQIPAVSQRTVRCGGPVSGNERERRQKKYGKMHSAVIIMSILVLYRVISSGISFITRNEKKENCPFERLF